MTIQAYKFLRLIQKIQIREEYCVEFDTFSKYITTAKCKKVEEKTAELQNNWKLCFDYLNEKGLVVVKENQNEDGLFISQLTHTGFHYQEEIISRFLAFMTKSIIVPVVVSIITTIITIKFNK